MLGTEFVSSLAKETSQYVGYYFSLCRLFSSIMINIMILSQTTAILRQIPLKKPLVRLVNMSAGNNRIVKEE